MEPELATAAPVKVGEVDVVGPTGVAVGLELDVGPPPAAPVETVPLDKAVERPVDKITVDTVLDGQYVVVYVEV